MLAMLTCMAERKPQQILRRWDDVRILLAVLRAGSFTQAACNLKTEQSTISRRIASLEDELGVTLFERGARAPSPTVVALALREVAETIEAEVGRLTDTAQQDKTRAVQGRVRLALTEEMASYFVVPEILPRLRQEYPELIIDLVTSYRASDLMGQEADIALRFFRSNRGDLVGKKLGEFETGVLCAKKRARTFQKKDISEFPWVTVELSGMPTLETQWLQNQISQAPVLTCSSYQVQLAAIRAGLGVGIGPKVVASLERDFVALPTAGFDLPRLELFLFTRRTIRALPKISVVFDALEDGFKAYVS